jgi:hypothetical protein
LATVQSDISKSAASGRFTEYAGGTASGNKFQFVCATKSGFQVETVDFDAKTIQNKLLFAPDKTEKIITSFNANNAYCVFAANDKKKELILYYFHDQQPLVKKSLPFTLPDNLPGYRDDISQFLSDPVIFQPGEYPALRRAVERTKIFPSTDKIDILINDNNAVTTIFTISLADFQTSQRDIDYGGIIGDKKKNQPMVTAYPKDGRLFSLVQTNGTLVATTHDMATGKLVAQHPIATSADFNVFNEAPRTYRQVKKWQKNTDVTSLKNLLHILSNGRRGLTVEKNALGQYILTGGTYDVLQAAGLQSGSYRGGFSTSRNSGETYFDPAKDYLPGQSSGFAGDAAYTTTSFQIVLDSAAVNVVHEKNVASPSLQIEEYLKTMNEKASAPTQFNLDGKQYFGYYDRQQKTYVIEEILIH